MLVSSIHIIIIIIIIIERLSVDSPKPSHVSQKVRQSDSQAVS